MSTITQNEAMTYAQAAGFSGNGLNSILAISQCESGLNTTAQNTNTDGSIDRGILQINSYWHREVSDSCAYDPACAYKAAYTISNGGTSFTPWTTYNGTCYNKQIQSLGQGITPGTTPTSTVSSALQGLPFGLGSIMPSIEKTITNFLEEMGVFIIALMVIIIGVYILAEKQVNKAVESVA